MGRTKADKPKTMLSIELSGPQRERLEAARLATDASSLVDVIRKALVVYEMFLETLDRGDAIIVRGKDGKEREVTIL